MSERRKTKKGQRKKTSKDTSTTKNRSNNPKHDQDITKLISDFDNLFLNEDKVSEKKMKEFSRNNLLLQSSDLTTLNTQNFLVFLFKISGLEIDTNDDDEIKKFSSSSLNLETFTDSDVISDLVENCKLRAKKIKISKLQNIIASVTHQIYNSYDIIHEDDFIELKNFIISLLKLTQNHYRALRHISCIFLSKVYELLFDEKGSILRVISQKKKVDSQTQSSKSDKSTITLLNNKAQIISELISLLREKFIEKKIADISQGIRLVICESLCRISKNHFCVLFNDPQLISYYPYFLSDPSSNIKIKYLQLIYDKLDDVAEGNNENLKILVRILGAARDAILSICIKEDKILAKQGIRIIELLSQHKILEKNTVQQLLPHLFNPESQIRMLVAKIARNYILNFEEEENEEKEEDDEEEMNNSVEEGEEKKKKEETRHKKAATLKDVNYLIEFVHKLSDNEPKMIKILVDDFYQLLEVFKNFSLFFQYIDDLISSTQAEMCLISTTLMVVYYSIEKIQGELEKKPDDPALLSKNEEFINSFISKCSSYLKKFRVPLYENIVNVSQCEILISLLDLFDKFKIYKNNVVSFGFEMINDIVNELKQSFFINTITFAHNETKPNSNTNGEAVLLSEKVLFEKLCENLLKAINYIMSNEVLFTSFNFNQTNFLDGLLYSLEDNSSSLAKKFRNIIIGSVLNNKYYQKILSTPLKDLHEGDLSISLPELEKFYVVFTQMNYLIIFFKKIFTDFTDFNLFKFALFLQKLLTINLSTIPNSEIIDFSFKLNSMILSLIETIHLLIFNIQAESASQVSEYAEMRNEIINMIFSIATLQYDQENKLYNNYLLYLKTKSIGILFDSLTYIIGDKLPRGIAFEITPEIEDALINFTRENFITFFLAYNRWFKSDVIKNEEGPRSSMVYQNKDANLFINELTIKTFCFKIFCEKFSRLLLLNFGIFKYSEISCLYFETFCLIKHQNVIETIVTYVLDTLMEKEVTHFLSSQTNKLTVMIYFLTKITMRIFNNKSKLFDDSLEIKYEDKIEMIGRYLNYYTKSFKKLKGKSTEVNVFEKDKNFYENFVLNGISFALDSKVESEGVTNIENVYFLEIIKMFLKINLFLNEGDIKNLIIAYLKLSKKIEVTDGMNVNHIKFMEKFKSYLLNKAKVVINKEIGDEEEEEEKKKNPKSPLENNEDEEEEEQREEEEEKLNEEELKTPVKSQSKNQSRRNRKRNLNELEKSGKSSQMSSLKKLKKRKK